MRTSSLLYRLMVILCFAGGSALAQDTLNRQALSGSGQQADSLLHTHEQEKDQHTGLIDQLDSMVLALHEGMFEEVVYRDSTLIPGNLPEGSDSIFRHRLSHIPAVIPLAYHPQVEKYIEMYVRLARGNMQKMLGLGQWYFPLFEEELDKRGLPYELKYLPVVESSLNTHARSRRGATGLWQIMYPTARLLNLEMNSYVDERRDPHKATRAALQYLDELHHIYKDWLLAIAAYNCGPGNMNKAIRRYGKKGSFWELWPYLPRETRGYVPAFIGAVYSFEYAREHLLYPRKLKYPVQTLDTIRIYHDQDMEQLAGIVGISPDELAFYNPSFKRNYIPASEEGYVLKLPLQYSFAYTALEDSIKEAAKALAAKSEVEVINDNGHLPAAAYPFEEEGKVQLRYRVKSGDNLGFIAEWYDVRVSELRRWNNIWGNRIQIGQQLNIFVDEDKKQQYEGINEMSFERKQALAGESVAALSEPETSRPSENGYFFYEVKEGDSFWDISQQFPDNSIEKILQLNQMELNTTLKPGDKIKLIR